MNQRSYLLDNMKAILIFLVVLGHMYTPFIKDSVTFESIYVFIYAFHMPLFIFVSGYLSKNIKKPVLDLVDKLIIPYVIFNSIWYLLVSYMQKGFTFSLFTPYGYMWYLLSLFAWRLLVKYIPKNKMILPISVVFGVIAGLLPLGEFLSLSRILGFLPFFLLGFFFKKEYFDVIKRTPIILSIGYLLVSAVLTWIFVTNGIRYEALYLSGTYTSTELTSINGILLRVAIYLNAVFMSLAIIRLIPDRQTAITYIGNHTMVIYIGHIFIRLAIDVSPLSGTAYTVVVLISPIVITYLLSLPILTKIYNAVFDNLSFLRVKQKRINA